MKKLAALVFCHLLLATFESFADLDTNLVGEINQWRKGDAPPSKLLKFPDGRVEELPGCGLTWFGAEVGHYISQIQNEELLTALIFDSRAQSDTLRDSLRQFIELKGVENLARLLARRKRESPNSIVRAELAVLFQLLHSPYVRLQVAQIGPAMNEDQAEKALQAMKRDLIEGMIWSDAYRKHSELHPDLRDKLKDPRSVRTLVGYIYDGVVSPEGFDILQYRLADTLPESHLQHVFRERLGTYVLKSGGAIYLYHVTSYWKGLGAQ